MTRRNKEQGQALVEAVVVFPLIIAVALGAMTLFLYTQVQGTAIQVARQGVWERSVWADWNNPWAGSDQSGLGGVARTVTRTDHDIYYSALAHQVSPELRIRSDRDVAALANASGLSAASASIPIWDGAMKPGKQVLGGNVAALADAAAPQSLAASLTMPWQSLMDNFSFDTHWAEPDGAQPARALAQPLLNVPPVNVSANLPVDTVATTEVAISLPNTLLRPLTIGLLRLDGDDEPAMLSFFATGAILTNPWAPKDENVFREKVHGLDLDQMVDAAVAPFSKIEGGVTGAMGGASLFLESIPLFGTLIKPGQPSLDSTTAALPFTRVIPSLGSRDDIDWQDAFFPYVPDAGEVPDP